MAREPAVVVDLAQVGAGDLATGGGKAANLGELLRAGFPVPPGFVITTAAYDQIAGSNDLAEDIAEVAEPGGAAKLRAAFTDAVIPPEIERSILDAYRGLGGGAVAVRSSATAEDLPEAAFAGQQETFLGIVDERALLGAVRRCWASLWSDRAIAYRERHGLAGVPVKLAVIVQRLVPADAAGVLFTANPITGARDEAIIDASTGLGEAVVGGLVTPDHIVLRNQRHRWRIVERTLGRREVEVRPRAGGGTEHIASTPASAPALPDEVMRQLARMGVSIARHFERPQDIEWAWGDGKLFILQSRPITALPEPPKRDGLGLPRFGPAEYFMTRPYPLDMTTWVPVMASAISRMLPIDGPFRQFGQLWVEEDGVVVGFAGWPEIRFTPKLALAPARLVLLALRHDPAHWSDDPLMKEIEQRATELEARNLRSLSWSGLLATVDEALRLPFTVMKLRRHYLPRAILALGGLRLLLGRLGHDDKFGALLSGVDSLTLEANRELENLASEIRADPALAAFFTRHDAKQLWTALESETAGRRFLAKVQAFLDRYGHRETASPLLMSAPTWKDAPEVVLGILKGLALESAAPREGRPAWEIARDDALANRALRLPPLRAAFVKLLTEARRFPSLREDTHYLMTRPLPVLRRAVLELGRRLAEIDVLDGAEDVFHLRFDELKRVNGTWPPSPELADELRDTARRRKARRAELADSPLLDASQISDSEPIAGALVAGMPGSPGVAEGPSRVVREATDFGTFQPGEVLVAPYTNPSWTPLFGRAAAVVVDAGSVVSHAAIVAREYGIPAVMGTGDGTKRLTDGQWVRVDGFRGQVFPVSAPGEDAAPRVAVDAHRQHEDGSSGDRLPERGDTVEIQRV